MLDYEEIDRINCRASDGRRVVIIEQRKWSRQRSGEHHALPVHDYMTESGEVASKLDDQNFLVLLTNEVFCRA
jgi:hypothetical protein